MYLEAFSDNPFDTNCWLLALEGREDALVIDPGFSPDRVRSLLKAAGKRPAGGLATRRRSRRPPDRPPRPDRAAPPPLRGRGPPPHPSRRACGPRPERPPPAESHPGLPAARRQPHARVVRPRRDHGSAVRLSVRRDAGL